MQYLQLLMQILSVISAVANALASAEQNVLPVLQTLWTDLQAAYTTIVSAITGGTTLSDDEVAKVGTTLANAEAKLGELQVKKATITFA